MISIPVLVDHSTFQVSLSERAAFHRFHCFVVVTSCLGHFSLEYRSVGFIPSNTSLVIFFPLGHFSLEYRSVGFIPSNTSLVIFFPRHL